MAKISQREKILLGYGSNSVSDSSSRRNSEVDFSDVFGGPPRSSAQDFYFNESENIDDNNGFTEKPVFGDQIGVRKRFSNDDFYGDIFGGDQPLLSSSRNSFASLPLSPAADASGTPSNFSLPGRISNTYYMTSPSMKQSSKSSGSGRSVSRLSHSFQPNSVYQPSSLSRDGKESSSEYEAEFTNDNIQFHFSIYKWGSKGVPMAMAMAMSCRKRSPSTSKVDDFLVQNAKDDDSFSASKRRMASLFGGYKEEEDETRKNEKEIDKSEGTAKVKDFVKIYNQESSSTLKSNKDGVSWRRKDKENDKDTTKNKVKTFSTKDDEMKASSISLGKNWSKSIEMVDAEFYLLEEQHTINGNGSDSGLSEPKIESTKAPRNIPATSVDYQVGKEMLQDIDTQLATDESLDETQSYELKVKQWSKGKEGNIRALLSTMQYVLWPNSGWKPIPLVDIIEANAVKKSYQRALLCLHPDKLQQKGAAPYQKFIAERIFDTLQEAWDEFNTLGLV